MLVRHNSCFLPLCSAQKKDDVDDCDTSDDFDNECILRNEGVRSPMNSTMISSISMMSSCDVQKISSMEDELAALRNQMAMLVLMQEQVNKSQGKQLCYSLGRYII